MLTPTHPHEERLSALAARDEDATADGTLTGHVDACDRCAALVVELGALRATLAELPDLAPSRPLRLLPPVGDPDPSAVDRLGEWVGRLFAPALAAGAALAMVGLVGTAAPALDGAASGGDAGALDMAAPEDDAARDGSEPQIMAASPETVAEHDTSGGGDAAASADEAGARSTLPAERSPWPMVLFTGVALVIGALLLRWILVPRAG